MTKVAATCRGIQIDRRRHAHGVRSLKRAVLLMNRNLPAAIHNLRSILAIAMEHDEQRAAVVVYDTQSELAEILVDAYLACLPGAKKIAFYDVAPDDVKASFDPLQASDLVVLIQSTSFRLPDFRIRVELYKRDIKVIEHSNLLRAQGNEIDYYVNALAYDPAYYRGIGHALKARIDRASSATVESGEVLRFDCALEPAKLNIGDFSTLKNVGSQFPIGEVFTEARDLERVQGRVRIYAFADTTFRLNAPETPITLVVDQGRVVDVVNSTDEFDRVMARITADEGEVWVRELGFGMNRAFGRDRLVRDVGAFERVCGIHLSLGAKHGVYKKPHLRNRETHHHVDVFVITDRVLLDGTVVFDNGAWCVNDVALMPSEVSATREEVAPS